jgi:hypothetical protein
LHSAECFLLPVPDLCPSRPSLRSERRFSFPFLFMFFFSSTCAFTLCSVPTSSRRFLMMYQVSEYMDVCYLIDASLRRCRGVGTAGRRGGGWGAGAESRPHHPFSAAAPVATIHTYKYICMVLYLPNVMPPSHPTAPPLPHQDSQHARVGSVWRSHTCVNTSDGQIRFWQMRKRGNACDSVASTGEYTTFDANTTHNCSR